MSSSAELFQYLKPVCVPLVRNPNKENLNRALIRIKELSSTSIQEKTLLEYIIFPFKLAFQNVKLGENEEILSFQCLGSIFSVSCKEVLQADILLWIFNLYSIYYTPRDLLTDKSSVEIALSKKQTRSEEQIFASLEMLTSLLTVTREFILEEVYTNNQNLPIVGHVVSITLNFLEDFTNKDLQVKTINCLKLLCGGSSTSKKLADTLSSFFPGIALTFNKFLGLSSSHSTKLLIPALDTFGYITCLVLNDCDLPQKENINDIQDLLKVKVKSPNKPFVVNEEKVITVKRNLEWFTATSLHMETVFKNILPVVMVHDNAKTRHAVINFVENLMKSCMVCLKSSLPDFLDVLAKLLSDSYPDVKERSKFVLKQSTVLFKEKSKILYS